MSTKPKKKPSRRSKGKTSTKDDTSTTRAESPSTVMEEINFEDLAGEFTRYYVEFDSALKSSPYGKGKSTTSEPFYCLFGVSGAGKTTLVARMRSDLPPEEFYKTVRERVGENKNMVTVEGLTIGHTASSTTVVPRVYPALNGTSLSLVDFPGFAETDPSKKILISVLQKCFLTRVKGATFLAVLDIKACFEVRPTSILDTYHKPLMKLLGDKYDSAIDHICWVLTKNDGVDSPRKTEDDLELQIGRWSREMIKENFDSKAVKLLVRILDRHVFVDLTTDTKEDVIEKIQAMIEKDHREKKQLEKKINLNIEYLEAGENELNRRSHQHSVELLGRLTQLSEAYGVTCEEIEERKSEMRAESDTLAAAKGEVLGEAIKLAKNLETVTAEIKAYVPETERTKQAINETEALLAMHQKSSTLFAQHLVDEDFINYRCDVSREVTRLGKKCYSAKLNVDVGSDGCTERVVVAMEYEPKNDTLKNYIGRDGSLIPKTIKHMG